jgi:hypothetical protein
VLEAAAFSPVRAQVTPTAKPSQVTDELLATVKRVSSLLPQIAALFDVEVTQRPCPRSRSARLARTAAKKPAKAPDGRLAPKPETTTGRTQGPPEPEAVQPTPDRTPAPRVAPPKRTPEVATDGTQAPEAATDRTEPRGAATEPIPAEPPTQPIPAEPPTEPTPEEPTPEPVASESDEPENS